MGRGGLALERLSPTESNLIDLETIRNFVGVTAKPLWRFYENGVCLTKATRTGGESAMSNFGL